MTTARATDLDARGFAGLSELASTLPPPPAVEKAVSTPDLKVEPRSIAPAQPVAREPFWSTGRKWFAAAAAFGGVVLLVNLNNSQTSSPRPNYQSVPQSYVQQPPATAEVSPANRLYANVEAKPEGIAQQMLNAPQIRYCLAERIRLGGLKKAAQNGSEYFANLFNNRVEDFNVRCANYRYYQHDMDEAQRGIRGRESSIEAEATSGE